MKKITKPTLSRMLIKKEDISNVNYSHITDMSYLLDGASALKTIPYLNTSNVTNMKSMFRGCSSLKTIPPLDVRNVYNMLGMFEKCISLETTPPLNTQNVSNMGYMFNNCENLFLVGNLDTQKVVNMENMFSGCHNLENIPKLNVENTLLFNRMFNNSPTLKPNLHSWKIKKGGKFKRIFNSIDVFLEAFTNEQILEILRNENIIDNFEYKAFLITNDITPLHEKIRTDLLDPLPF